MKFSAMLLTSGVLLVTFQVVVCEPCGDYDFRSSDTLYKRLTVCERCHGLGFFEMYDKCASELCKLIFILNVWRT